VIQLFLKYFGDVMEIGKRILLIRKDLQYSQRTFAMLLGCAQSTVSDWENGWKKPACDYLIKILELEEFLKKRASLEAKPSLT